MVTREAFVPFVALALLGACSGAEAQDSLFADTVFSDSRLDRTRNNQRVFDFYRCNCLTVPQQYESQILGTSLVHATNVYAIETGRSANDFQIQLFPRSGSYSRLLRLLGVGFEVVEDLGSANFVVDYSWSSENSSNSEAPGHQTPDVCSVEKHDGVVTVGINSDLEHESDDFYSEVARCYSVGFLGVFGFGGWATGDPFDVSEANPPDLYHRVVYRYNVIGFVQSFESQCSMALYRLLEDGAYDAQEYYQSLILVSERLSTQPQSNCLPTRAVVLDVVEERREERE